jgi:hypothetical protein
MPKYLASFWKAVLEKRMQINFTDPVKNEVQQEVNEEKSIPCTTKRRKTECIGHILRRNCLLRHVIGRNIEGKRRQGRRGTQLLGGFKETKRYGSLKEKALDRTV